MKVRYNAPTVLTFAVLSAVVLILSQTLLRGLNQSWFAAPGRGRFNPALVRSWFTLLSHVIGHADWNHLLSNFAFILLIGPILEEAYGSVPLLVMMLLTALVTGLLNVIFFPWPLMGASGIVFMMILLASFTNFSRGEIPLTFILVLIIYLGRELYNSFGSNNISEFAHIAGGFCGSLFGFFRARK
ncbi:MAG: rhomboid family intramembrane serine protease [Treponema sp.]|nr:rhomboid family intramembrane serine protease [Treponema sp.]